MSVFLGSRCNCCTTITGKNATHIITTTDCGNCHSTTVWTSTKALMHSTSNCPGDHGVPLTSNSYHTTNSETIPWPSPAYAPYCAARHEKDYIPSAHGGRFVATNKDCGRCHRVTFMTWGN